MSTFKSEKNSFLTWNQTITGYALDTLKKPANHLRTSKSIQNIVGHVLLFENKAMLVLGHLPCVKLNISFNNIRIESDTNDLHVLLLNKSKWLTYFIINTNISMKKNHFFLVIFQPNLQISMYVHFGGFSS